MPSDQKRMISAPQSVARLTDPKSADRIFLRRHYKGLNFVFNRDKTKVQIYFRGEVMQNDPIADPAAFSAEWHALDRGEPAPEKAPVPRESRAVRGTWGAAAEELLDTPWWKGGKNVKPLAKNTKRIYAPLIELIRTSGLGKKLMRQTTPWTVVAIHNAVLAERGANAANAFQTPLRKIVEIGELNGWVRDNVNLMRGIKQIDVEHQHYQPHDGNDIERYLAKHGPDTMAYKAFQMIHWLAPATCDLVTFCPADIDEFGNILITRSKTGGGQYANIHDLPELQAVIESFDRTGKDPSVPFLHNESGKPFLENTFRLYWRNWRKEAGVANKDFAIHGGRATLVTDMEDAGVRVEDGMTRTGHKDARVYKQIYGHKASKVIASRRATQQVNAFRAAKKASREASGLRVVAG